MSNFRDSEREDVIDKTIPILPSFFILVCFSDVKTIFPSHAAVSAASFNGFLQFHYRFSFDKCPGIAPGCKSLGVFFKRVCFSLTIIGMYSNQLCQL